METPHKKDALQFVLEIVNFRNFHAQKVETGEGYICKHCGATILSRMAFISIHSARFEDCAGSGFCKPFSIPYCPVCEHIPESSGCIHCWPDNEKDAQQLLARGTL